MTQLVITLKDQSYLPNIRRIVKSLVGVEKVSTAKPADKPAARRRRLSRYEPSLLISRQLAVVVFRVTNNLCSMPRKDE